MVTSVGSQGMPQNQPFFIHQDPCMEQERQGEQKILKSSNGICWKSIPKEQVNFVVAPKEASQTYSHHELPRGNKKSQISIKY